MHKKRITIVTGTGGILGNGHIQRMLTLALDLNKRENFSSSIFLVKNEYPVEQKFSEIITDSIHPDTDLIIRDMRDSTLEDIRFLQNTAPVLVIDDSGEGKKIADFSVNLLPVPSEKPQGANDDSSFFLFGYNFKEGIRLLEHKLLSKKDIDVSVYAGYSPSSELIELIAKSIPENADAVLLAGGIPQRFSGERLSAEAGHTEIIARSKIVITHFGLTMYEADACGCSVAALNPTPYHTSLTDIVGNKFNIICSYKYDSFKPEELMNTIKSELKRFSGKNISSKEILKRITSTTDNFIDYIDKICIPAIETSAQTELTFVQNKSATENLYPRESSSPRTPGRDKDKVEKTY